MPYKFKSLLQCHNNFAKQPKICYYILAIHKIISKKIYKNGVYILFEKNESGHNGDRIVRIGSHTGNDNLVKRLEEHFLKENKDRSIFRKNIGRALLNKNSDSETIEDKKVNITMNKEVKSLKAIDDKIMTIDEILNSMENN